MKAAKAMSKNISYYQYAKTAIKAAAKGALLMDCSSDMATMRWFRRTRQLSLACHPIDMSCEYIYFPLNYQPEMTTSPLGGFFCDQISALRALASAIPEGWFIYVKEHPSQYLGHSYGYLGRTEHFYQQLNAIPQVRMVPIDLHSQPLIDRSKMVATITGSAGYESLARSKCVIVFGDVWYGQVHGCFRVDKPSDARNAVDKALNLAIIPAIVESQFHKIAQESISFFGEPTSALSYGYPWDPRREQLAIEEFLHGIIRLRLFTT
jgi:hypothetical protein